MENRKHLTFLVYFFCCVLAAASFDVVPKENQPKDAVVKVGTKGVLLRCTVTDTHRVTSMEWAATFVAGAGENILCNASSCVNDGYEIDDSHKYDLKTVNGIAYEQAGTYECRLYINDELPKTTTITTNGDLTTEETPVETSQSSSTKDVPTASGTSTTTLGTKTPTVPTTSEGPTEPPTVPTTTSVGPTEPSTVPTTSVGPTETPTVLTTSVGPTKTPTVLTTSVGPTESSTVPATSVGPTEPSTVPATSVGPTEPPTVPTTTSKGPTEPSTVPITSVGPTEPPTVPTTTIVGPNEPSTALATSTIAIDTSSDATTTIDTYGTTTSKDTTIGTTEGVETTTTPSTTSVVETTPAESSSTESITTTESPQVTTETVNTPAPYEAFEEFDNIKANSTLYNYTANIYVIGDTTCDKTEQKMRVTDSLVISCHVTHSSNQKPTLTITQSEDTMLAHPIFNGRKVVMVSYGRPRRSLDSTTQAGSSSELQTNKTVDGSKVGLGKHAYTCRAYYQGGPEYSDEGCTIIVTVENLAHHLTSTLALLLSSVIVCLWRYLV